MASKQYGPSVSLLSSGYVHLRWSSECWAQFWPDVDDIPDEAIFNPAWNGQRVREWWVANRDRLRRLFAEESRHD